MSRLMSSISRHSALASYATVLVAFFLRAYRLADKNIWWDEGWSIWLAKQDFVAIALRTAADEHPPLHYWMLKGWMVLFGSSAYSGRFLSVVFGVLTVALLYRIGKRAGGSWIGVLGAFILAISRFHIWWSQDIKNYTPSICFAFAAVWFALRVVASNRGDRSNRSTDKPEIAASRTAYPAMTAYALFAALAVFTHYLSALVLLALNLYALIALRHSSPLLRRWILANILAGILFAPWLYLYLQNAQPWVAAPTFDFGLFLKLVATVLPLGVTTDIDNYSWFAIAFGVLALLGCAWVFVSRNPPGRNTLGAYALFALIVALPPILIYILSLTPAAIFAPKIQARYLVVLAPAYAMLLAHGIAFLARWKRNAALAGLLFIFASNAFVLNEYYSERRLTDDYATLANNINAFARQGDLVLLDTDQEWPTFLYYLRVPLDWLGVPNGASMTDGDADALVKRTLARHDAIWLVTIPDALSTDPQKMVEARLAHVLPKRYDRTYGNKRVVFYSPDERDFVNVAPENFSPRSKLTGNNILGFDLPIREARAGDTVRVVTYWNLSHESQIQIRLGQVSAIEKVGAGNRSRVESDLILPPNASGELPLMINETEIARIRVEPRPNIAPTGQISYPTNYALGSIRLVGYDLPQTQLRANSQLPITIYWTADQAATRDYSVFVHILGSEFNAAQNNFLWGQLDRIPTIPPTAWQPNQTVADAYRVPISANAPAGKYKIEVGMYDAATGVRLKSSDGSDIVILTEIDIVR